MEGRNRSSYSKESRVVENGKRGQVNLARSLADRDSLYIAFLFVLAALLYYTPQVPRWFPRLEMILVFVLMGGEILVTSLFQRLLAYRLGSRSLGFNFIVAPGTIIHEVSHALLVVLTGSKLKKVVLFKPDHQTGTLGQVTYEIPVNRWTTLRAILIGMAPYLGCGLAVYFLIEWPRPKGLSWPSVVLIKEGSLLAFGREFFTFFYLLFEHSQLPTYGVALCLFFALVIAQGAAPSPQDFKSAWQAGGFLSRALSLLVILALAVVFFVFLPIVGHTFLTILVITAVAQLIFLSLALLWTLVARIL